MSRLARFFKKQKSNVKVSRPTGVVHKTHVSFDANQGEFFASGAANEITEALRIQHGDQHEESESKSRNAFQSELNSVMKPK